MRDGGGSLREDGPEREEREGEAVCGKPRSQEPEEKLEHLPPCRERSCQAAICRAWARMPFGIAEVRGEQML